MNPTCKRTAGLLVAVVGFAVIAIWHLAVRPLEAQTDEQRKQLEAAIREVDQGRADIAASPVDPDTVLQELVQHSNDFKQLFAELESASDIYNRFDPLAKQAGITVKRLEPTRQETMKDYEGANVAISEFVVECDGSLDAITGFMSLIQNQIGLSTIVSFRINPTQAEIEGVPQVHASIKTSHVMVSGLFEKDGAQP